MAHMHDLPDEILTKIFKYLDYFALFNLSKTCKRFGRFYREPQVVRRSYFDNQCARDNVCWTDIRNFFKYSKLHITHLNLSYVHWLPTSDLRKSLSKLKFLQYLNVIETNLYIAHVKEIVQRNSLLKSVALSYSSNDPSDLTQVWMDLNSIHFFVKNIPLQNLLTKFFRMGYPNMTVKLELVQESDNYETFFLKYWRQLLQFDFKRYFITSHFPNFGHALCEKHCPLMFKYRSEKEPTTHHIFMETYHGILLSHELCTDVIDNDLIKHYATYFTLEQHYNYDPLTLYICRAEEGESETIHKYANERIRVRMNEVFYFRRNECFLDDNVSLVSHFKNAKTLKTICMDECHLCVMAESPKSDLPLFKKLRTSRIPQIPKGKKNVFRKIIDCNTEIESFKTITNGSRECFKEDHNHDSTKLVMDRNSLIDLAKLTNLKHLSLSVIPDDAREFFTEVFSSCIFLEYIGLFKIMDFHNSEVLSELLHLCKNVKILRIHSQIRKMDAILENLSKCHSLEVMEIVDQMTVIQKKQMMSLLQLLQLTKHCDNLRYLKIHQHDLNRRDITQYKRFENVLRSKNEYLFVNLTEFEEHLFFNRHTYDLKVTVM